MKLDLQGDFEVGAAPEAAWALLTDPEKFAPLLPMYCEHRWLEDGRFVVVLEVGVPQVKGRMEAQVRMHPITPWREAKFISSARHALGMADSEVVFRLDPQGSATLVRWTSTTLVRGTLASLANGILRPLAARNVNLLIDALRQALAVPGQPAHVAEPVSNANPQDSTGTRWWHRLLAWFGWSAGGRT